MQSPSPSAGPARVHLLALACGVIAFAGSGPFWETKQPAEWAPEEVQRLLEDSPWARSSRGRDDFVRMHLATAKPMQEAESRERAAQSMRGANDASYEEYLEMLKEAPGKYIVIAVHIPGPKAFRDDADTSHIESDSRLFSGKNQVKPVTFFPPSSSDPYMRVVFPRKVDPNAKSLEFTIYVPGMTDPYRRLIFTVNKMNYRGHLEY